VDETGAWQVVSVSLGPSYDAADWCVLVTRGTAVQEIPWQQLVQEAQRAWPTPAQSREGRLHAQHSDAEEGWYVSGSGLHNVAVSGVTPRLLLFLQLKQLGVLAWHPHADTHRT
jgi:hypothetical protein